MGGHNSIGWRYEGAGKVDLAEPSTDRQTNKAGNQRGQR
jgi:hypothetical protein